MYLELGIMQMALTVNWQRIITYREFYFILLLNESVDDIETDRMAVGVNVYMLLKLVWKYDWETQIACNIYTNSVLQEWGCVMSVCHPGGHF